MCEKEGGGLNRREGAGEGSGEKGELKKGS